MIECRIRVGRRIRKGKVDRSKADCFERFLGGKVGVTAEVTEGVLNSTDRVYQGTGCCVQLGRFLI